MFANYIGAPFRVGADRRHQSFRSDFDRLPDCLSQRVHFQKSHQEIKVRLFGAEMNIVPGLTPDLAAVE